MSLTSQLQDPLSPVRVFMQTHFPNLCEAGGRGKLGKEIANSYGFDQIMDYRLIAPVPDEVKVKQSHSPVIGTAFDYRTRMMMGNFNIGDSIAAKGLSLLHESVDQSPAARHYANMLIGACIIANDRAKSGSSEDSDTLSIILTWAENIYRAGPFALSGSLGERLRRSRTPEDLIESIETSKLDDLANLRRANRVQIEIWKLQINQGVRFDPNPTFEGSRLIGADADWIIEDTLIECKTTERLSNGGIRNILLQLLGYALLDFDNQTRIQSLGIWLPRRAAYQSWPLEDLIYPYPLDSLPNLRSQFRDDLESWRQELSDYYSSLR